MASGLYPIVLTLVALRSSIVTLGSVEDMEKQTSTKELIALVEGARKVNCADLSEA